MFLPATITRTIWNVTQPDEPTVKTIWLPASITLTIWNITQPDEPTVANMFLPDSITHVAKWIGRWTQDQKVGQTPHSTMPLPTQQWWVPGGRKTGKLWMALAAENALNYPQRKWDRIRESSSAKGVIIKSAEPTGISDYKHLHLYLFIYLHWPFEILHNLIHQQQMFLLIPITQTIWK